MLNYYHSKKLSYRFVDDKDKLIYKCIGLSNMKTYDKHRHFYIINFLRKWI